MRELTKEDCAYTEINSIEKVPHMVSLAEIKEAPSRLRGIAVRTEVLQSHLPKTGRPTTIASSTSNPKTCSPSALSSCVAHITKLHRFQMKSVGRGVISYSSGNHAQGVAYAARALE